MVCLSLPLSKALTFMVHSVVWLLFFSVGLAAQSIFTAMLETVYC